MAKRCDICGKKADTGHRRSHSNIANKAKREVNLQTKKINGQTKKVCTSCLKSGLKNNLS